MFLKFSNKNGAHIELTICIKEQDKIDTVKFFSNRLNEFLMENKSPKPEIKDTEFEFFKSFPNNTVQYGIHSYPFLKKNNFEIYHHQITFILIDIYKEYKEDVSNSLTEIILQLLALFCFVV